MKEWERVNLPMVLGFALCQCWLTLCFFAPQLFPDDRSTSVYEISLIVTAIGLLPGVVAARKVEDLMGRTSLIYLMAILSSVGTVLIPFSATEGALSAVIMVAAALLTGLGGGWLFIGWYRAFCRSDDLVGFVISVTAQSIILYILTNILLPPTFSPWIMMSVAFLMPFASAYLLAHQGRSNAEIPVCDHELPRIEPCRRRAIVHLCAGMFVISFIDEFMRNQYLDSTDLVYYSGTVNLVVLLLKIICSVVIVAALLEPNRNVQLMYKASFLLTMIAVLFMPYLRSDFGYGITNFGAFFFKIIVMLVAFNYCRRYRISPVLLFSLTRIIWSLDLFIGYVACEAAGPAFASNSALLGITSVLMGIAIVATYLFVFTTADGKDPIFSTAKSTDTDNAARHEARCSRLARVGKLSARESEVLLLVTRGRSTPWIQEELNLSSNTVNTHIRHIYQKLGVHSRQDLLDLVEQTAPDDKSGTS